MNIKLADLPGLVYLKDRDSKMIDGNTHFITCLGYSSLEDLLGKTPSDLAWTHYAADRILQTDQQVLANNTEHTSEEILKHISGNFIKLFTSKRCLKNDTGETIGLLCLCHDVTFIRGKQMEAEIEREKAEAANNAKSAFLACMSHDLRTPLNAINGMAQILQTQNLLPTHAEFVNDILASCAVLKSLIEDILNLSKIESNQLEFSQEPIDLRLIANEVISQLNFLAEQKNIVILLSYNEEVPRFLMGDSRRIRQILMNLIGNAIKFTHDGQILLAIEPINITTDFVEFQIAVEDSGIGIPQEKISSVFEKFYQVETHQKHEGTGLGLSIVEHLVTKMDGKIQVNSQMGKGSTFWCSLKLKRQIDTSQYNTWKKIANDFLVLIVDNDTQRAEYIERLIGTKNIIYASQDIALNVLHHQNQVKPALMVLIHENILVNDENFIDKFLLQQMDRTPKFIVYGHLTDVNLFKNKKINEFISTSINDSELIRVLLGLHKQLEDEQPTTHQLNFKKETPKILLVEDNPINQKVISIMLSNHGCDIEIASNGQQASVLALNDFDLIFMDIGLPDTNGLEVTRKLMENEQFNRTTPIVALTAHVSEQDKRRCLDAGMTDFITKPISEADLGRILEQHLA